MKKAKSKNRLFKRKKEAKMQKCKTKTLKKAFML